MKFQVDFFPSEHFDRVLPIAFTGFSGLCEKQAPNPVVPEHVRILFFLLSHAFLPGLLMNLLWQLAGECVR